MLPAFKLLKERKVDPVERKRWCQLQPHGYTQRSVIAPAGGILAALHKRVTRLARMLTVIWSGVWYELKLSESLLPK